MSRDRYKACGSDSCCFTDDKEYVKALESRVKMLEGDILFVLDRWWPFVHGSVSPSNTAYNGGKRLGDNLNDPVWRKVVLERQLK
jgi:hypothetical protein